ncbi:neuroblast differentiation-associated protein AHNAK-like isoform X2 [Xyrichtys novacula]|uniref:Neuroblast differentiation-associated protein AHNAK-like isoform X2 n=1 Tax=Xyrichtys novacula TaxID=13765 RepID=A0AAV1GMJ5_XYRNO|nr:neuroblast differentiation-associated protein AHNAK-like isoform X2 [Xyrichtys novacula]
MCDCFHLAFPNWHAASSETGGGRRLRGAEPVPEDNSVCDEPSQFTEGERPRPQGSSPVEEYPEMEKYTESDKECEGEHDPHRKGGSGKKSKKSGLGSMFEKRSTLKTSKLKEAPSPEAEVIVKTAQDGCAEGLVYRGGGKDGIFIKEVVPESPASKNLKLKEGDQVLSATVYFDNVPYEDAIQILEHAQAYKVKLCLKRKPDISETEPIMDSDVIPEDETYTPEMRERGKTKRRADARISWPKFHTLGKKSHFTRSHSSSEADEQRKLELSPTTSDTESPIKSQDALKGKKKNKLKLSFLKMRGRVSSSEDLCSDTTTNRQTGGKTLQTQESSDVLSPEGLESPSGETPEVYVTGDQKGLEDLRAEQTEQNLTHKMELVSIDSTLKTEDLTVALADQESPSGAKSPDGKKKKKERSELKMKILGKDKSHKKEAKAKASPKRLKTLGASIEIADQPDNEKTNAIPSTETHKELHGDDKPPDAKTQPISSENLQIDKSVPQVELEKPDVKTAKKSPKKGEKSKKSKDKQKQDTKAFKLPKIGFGDLTTEEEIPKLNASVGECTVKIEPPTADGTDVKEDPYERLSKSSLSRTQLPKREDIEIPGMEDVSRKTATKGSREAKMIYTGHFDEIPSDPIPISIDVDSVKEAVSKLPGYKLPKVDTSGVPIPEEITVIDANAQRISVKTPTKVVDAKTKHETHFTKFDMSASPSISKTTVKPPKIPTADLTSEVLLVETKIEKKDKTGEKESNIEIKTGVHKREDIIIPGKESAAEVALLQAQHDKKSKKTKKSTPGFGITMPDIRVPDIGIDLPKQSIAQNKDDDLKGERTIFLQDVQMTVNETKTVKVHTGGVISDVKIPEIDGIEYIDSVGEKDGGIRLKGFGLDVAQPNADFSLPEKDVPKTEKAVIIDGAEIKIVERERHGGIFKMPSLGISMPKVEGPKIDLGLSKKDVDVTLPGAKAEVELQKVSEVKNTLGNIDVSVQGQKIKVEKPELEIKSEQSGQGGKIKMPELGIKMKAPQYDLSFSKKDVDVKLPEAHADVKLPEFTKTEVQLADINVSIPEEKLKVKTPDIKIKPLQTEAELEGHGGKIKMPKIGITMPKLEGPEFNVSLSKKGADVALPDATVETSDVPKIDVKMKSPKIESEMDEQGSKFKKFEMSMPKVKMPEIDFSLSKKEADVKLPEAKADVTLPDAELPDPSAQLDIKVSKSKSSEKNVDGSPSKFKMPSLKLPKFGVTAPNVGVDISKKPKAVPVPEAQLKTLEEGVTVDLTAPSIDIEGPSLDVKKTAAEIDGKGHKFKMPKLGISVPKVKGPEIDLSLSQPEAELPEVEAEVKLLEVECAEPGVNVQIKAPEVSLQQPNIEGSPLKFKMPTFKLPKFGSDVPNASVEVPDLDKDAKLEGPDFNISAEGLAANVTAPSIEGPSVDMQTTGARVDGKGMKFKMPNLGLSMPKAKGPKLDFSISKKDGDVTVPVVEADVKLPKADLGKVDVSIPESTIKVPDAEVDVKLPKTTEINVEMKPPEFETEGTSGKFKMPKFGINLPKVKGPDIDLSLSKKDVDMSLPQANVEVKLPDAPKLDVNLGKAEVTIPDAKVEMKQPEVEIKPLMADAELDKQGSRFKLPKFGIKMPKVKGPEFDINFSKKDVDVTLGEATADVKVPDVDVKIPSADLDIQTPKIEAHLEGSPSKVKLPTFKLPKVEGATPTISAEVPEKDIHIKGAELKIPKDGIDIEVPNIDIVGPSLDVKINETEVGGKESKFKMPKFGISLPKVQGPKIDISSSKKGVDVKLPDVKAELPEAPEIDVSLGKVDVSIPEATIEIEKPQLEMESLQSQGEFAGQESKFKMPKFGIKMPKVKGPEIDISLSKKGDITLPEAKAEVTLPDVKLKDQSAEVEIKAPEIEVQPSSVKASPSKFKMPTFKFPKFGVGAPNVSIEGPDFDKEIKIDGADVQISVPPTEIDVPKVEAEVHLPEVEVKDISGVVVIDQQPGVEVDVKMKKPKFSLPSFSFSKSSVKAPEVDVNLQDVNATIPEVTGPGIDLSISKKDVDVTLPEAKAAVKLPEVQMKGPSAEVEMKSPEIKAVKKDTEGSPSRYKMPTFKLPKFGMSTPSATAELPEHSTDLKIHEADIKLPEEILTVDIKGPKIDIKTESVEHEGKGSKFKMPKLGVTMPKVKGPDIDLSLSKKDVDVTLPEVEAEAKAEVKLSDVDLKGPSAEVDVKAPEIKVKTKDKEGSPSKFKMPTFKLPKFGVSLPSAHLEGPDTSKDLSVDGADVTIPEKDLKVSIAAPDIDIIGPSIDITSTGTGHEEKGGKFKMPSLGFSTPQVKGPDIDLSLSKKEVDVTLPEVKADVKLSGTEVQGPTTEVDIKAPEIKVKTKEGSPSKFKMPTFKLPKFGVSLPSASVEGPNTSKDLSIDGADATIPETDLKVDIAAPSIDVKGPSIDIKTTGTDHEMKGGKFKMPSLGFSTPQVKGPDIDFSLTKKDVDVTLPEAKAEVTLPDVDVKGPTAEVDIKAPDIKIQAKDKEGSPSKFKMPTFKLPKFGISMPSATVEVPEPHIEAKINGDDIKMPEEVLTVTAPSTDTEGLSVDMKVTGTEHEGKGSKFKMPKLGVSMPKATGPEIKGPDIDLSLSKKEVDVTLPEVKADVKLSGTEVQGPTTEVDIKAPEIKVKTKEGSPSKFKMPTFKLPKFGGGSSSATVELPDTDEELKIGGTIGIPDKDLKVDVSVPDVDIKGPSIEIKTTETDKEGKGSKFKMPSLGFSAPHVKGPNIDLSLSKKDVDVTLPEAKAEVKLPEVEMKGPSAEIEVKAPAIKPGKKDSEGSPSKYKLPTFKLPKFGVSTRSGTMEMPESETDLVIDGEKVRIYEKELKIDVAAPSIDIEGPSIDIKTKGVEHEGKGSKFKMPSLGFSAPQVKGPNIDLSLSKKYVDVTLPEAKVEVEVKGPSADAEIDAPAIKGGKDIQSSPSKFKMPTFKLPKFGVSLPSATVEGPDTSKDLSVDGADVTIPKKDLKVSITAPDIDVIGPSIDIKSTGTGHEEKGGRFKMPSLGFSTTQVKGPDIDLSLSKKDVKIEAPSIDMEGPSIDIKTKGVEHEGKGSRFKMPSLGFSAPQVKGPNIDLSLSKKDVDVTLPEVKAEVKLPELKDSSTKVEMAAPGIDVKTSNIEGSPTKFKMPTFKMPKFGATPVQVSAELPDIDKNIKIESEKLELSKEGVSVDVTGPSADIEGLSVDLKGKGREMEGSGSKFKLPTLGISLSKVKGPEVDVSLSKTDVDVTLPEANAEIKLPDVGVKDLKDTITAPDAPSVEVDAKLGRPSWSFPKFSFSSKGAKTPDIDVNIETPEVDISSGDAKIDLCPPDVDIQGPSGTISTEEPTAIETDANLKRYKFSLPRLSFSKSAVKEPEVSAEPPQLDISLQEGKVIVTQPSAETKGEPETEHDGQGSKFKLPRFGIALPKAKEPQEELNVSQKDVDIKLPEVTLQAKLPGIEVKSSSSGEAKASETAAKAKDAGRSPLKSQSVEVKMDGSKEETPDTETPATEGESVGPGSPSKFRLPSFKMPKLSFSRSKSEDQNTPVETECRDDQVDTEPKEESKSPKVTLTSFGEILKSIDVEFDVSKTEENLETSKEVHKTDELSGKETKEKEAHTKQDASKSPERTGWFKFPKFGLSSPSEPAKIPVKDKDGKSPEVETVDDTVSPTCSVQSSDAFADISSAMTSEHIGVSLSSPTKVTVKYSDPSTATELGEVHSNIITSTTRTEMISVEPDLPEKITILSSGVSSSSEDTLRLESGKIHVITSNIEATPGAQQAKLLTTLQVQSAGGVPLQSETTKTASWTIDESKGGKTTVYERHLVTETTGERSESKETVVITKQITRMLDSAEHISGETATSIQRLKKTVHSEKMKFFDEVEK